ncbi:hypothetical protein L6R49_24245 [Myxococcota bacterium]|nr:hypothetical protein [Myxococcota bacterium]
MWTLNDRVVRLTLTLVGFFGALSSVQAVWASKCWPEPDTNGAELLRLTVKVDGEHVPEEDPLSLSWSTVGYLHYSESPTDDGSPPQGYFLILHVPARGDSFHVEVNP